MSAESNASADQYNAGRISGLAGNKLEQINYGDTKVEGYRSIFSRYNLFSFGPVNDSGPGSATPFDEASWGNDKKRTDFRNPSTNLLCTMGLGAVEYEYSDFAYCKDFGEIPNHWMITLRRFGSPVGDNIWDTTAFGNQPDVARAIGYMTDEKNKLDDMLGFSVKMTFKELKSEIQTVQSTGYGANMPGKFLSASKLLDSSGSEGRKDLAGDQANNFDPVSSYTNRVYGPIDVVDKIMTRDRGLESNMSYELTFEYELKSIDGVNPRAAMMDLFTNLLLLTYNKGDFWGGATRYTGRKPPKFLGDPKQLQNGDFVGYASSILSDALGAFDNLTGGAGLSPAGLLTAAKTIGSNAMGMLGGQALDKMGRPDVIAIHSLLKGDETGEWHLTIGNPFYPIAVVGNLILEDSKFQFSGPMGVDGFPSKLTLTCSLKPAMSRDRVGIQQMFSYGGGIIKAPLSPDAPKDYYLNYSLSKNNGGKNQKSIVDQNLNSLESGKLQKEVNRFKGTYDQASIDFKRNYNT